MINRCAVLLLPLLLALPAFSAQRVSIRPKPSVADSGDQETICTKRNFFTELLHPMMRSSVQRISVPSQTAEVSW